MSPRINKTVSSKTHPSIFGVDSGEVTELRALAHVVLDYLNEDCSIDGLREAYERLEEVYKKRNLS